MVMARWDRLTQQVPAELLPVDLEATTHVRHRPVVIAAELQVRPIIRCVLGKGETEPGSDVGHGELGSELQRETRKLAAT